GKDLLQARQARIGRGVVRVSDPLLPADDAADLLPHRRLGDEIQIRVRIGLPSLALDDGARLTAARCIGSARYGFAKLAVRILRIFLHYSGSREALLIAQLDPTQVQHAILHGAQNLLTATRGVALIQCSYDSQRQMQPSAAVADLSAGHQRRTVVESGSRGGAAGALSDILVHLAIFIRTGPKPLDRSHDHAWVELLDPLPAKAHPLQSAGCEVLHQDIAML